VAKLRDDGVEEEEEEGEILWSAEVDIGGLGVHRS
jgi:hypothetical protein